jgi:LmbE family N-acetylglucosaminyl deacetylase
LLILISSNSYLENLVLNNAHQKVAFNLPHPDDETIDAGEIISLLLAFGSHVHFDLMASGNGGIANTPLSFRANNYYNATISQNASEQDRKGIIREDSFKQVMKILNVTDYSLHHLMISN